MNDVKTILATAATLVITGLCIYGLWSVRSFFYYDVGAVTETVKELIKPECLK